MSCTETEQATQTIWNPLPQKVSISPGVTIPLSAGKRTRISFVTIFADKSNSVAVAIGPTGMRIATAGLPSIAYFQLDAGRNATLYTDNVFTEYFDLYFYAAAHNSASATCILYVTIYQPLHL